MSKSTLFAKRMERMQRSTIREILKLTKQAGMISFGGGLPAPELFPLKDFGDALQKAITIDGASALQYDVTEGYPPLKEFLCHWLISHGIPATPDGMMLTNGSQQALDLLGKIFINPGDAILVEDPTYLGALQAFNAYQPKYLTVPMDADGLKLPEAEKVLRRSKAKIAYLVPTFQNPSGATMHLERRQAFIKLARHHHLPVIEDDPYGYLRFRGTAVPSLYALAKGRGVIYLSTFSKILSPGIRVGFVLAEPPVINALVLAKQAADLQPNSLIQRAVYHYGQAGHLDRHIPPIIEAYRKRAEHMMEAMRRYFPPEVLWTPPEGGMFIWCTLPKKVSATRLIKKAIQQNVAYVTGSVFHSNGGGHNTLRLNFTNSSYEQIDTGIQKLGDVFRSAI